MPDLRLELSAVEVHHLAAVGTIPGATPLAAAARNGQGAGTLSNIGTDLQWTAPGSATAGTAVDCSDGGAFTLADGEDVDAWLRVAVTVASLASAAEAWVYLADRYNNGVAEADVDAEDATTGQTLEYQLTLRNADVGLAHNIAVYLESSADDRIWLSADGATWSQPTTAVAGVSLGTLLSTESATLYLKRIVAADAACVPSQLVHLIVNYDYGPSIGWTDWIRKSLCWYCGTATASVPTLIAVRLDCKLDGRGLYRIFNAAEYRLYRSNSAPPAESDTPFATTASLPYTPDDTFADGTWYLSMSYFNGVLDSGFLPVGPLGETYIKIVVDSGVIATTPPNGPLNWHLELLPAGVVRVIGVGCQSDEYAPDEWAVFYAVDGGSDVEVNSTFSQPYSVLDSMIPAQADAAVVVVGVKTRRNDGTTGSPTWVYSDAQATQSVTVDAVGPTAPAGGDDYPGPVPEAVEA